MQWLLSMLIIHHSIILIIMINHKGFKAVKLQSVMKLFGNLISILLMKWNFNEIEIHTSWNFKKFQYFCFQPKIKDLPQHSITYMIMLFF